MHSEENLCFHELTEVKVSVSQVIHGARETLTSIIN